MGIQLRNSAKRKTPLKESTSCFKKESTSDIAATKKMELLCS